MSELNIIKLNPGDTQENLTSKINQNFDSLVSSSGGPRGRNGLDGKRGSIGDGGGKGDAGQQGTRGTRWFIGPNEPDGGISDPVYYGDYWIRTTTGDNDIFQYSASGWVSTGNNMKASEVFKILENIQGGAGNGNAIVFNTPFPDLNTLVLSDSTLTEATANPTYAKLLISTNGTNDYPLIEFAKTNVASPGLPADYTRRPHFRWLSPTTSAYGLLLNIPQDDFSIVAGGNFTVNSTAGSLFILGNAGVTLESGGNMSIISNDNMTLSAGTNDMIFTSQNFQISSSLFSLTMPINISTTTSSPGLSIVNTGNGSGLWISSLTNSSSYYLANFKSAGTSKFGVRNDGRINIFRTINSFTNMAGARDNNGTYSQHSEPANENSVDWWNFGATGTNNAVTNGNTVYADLSLNTGEVRGIAIPLKDAPGSWDEYLSHGQSINIRVFAASNTKKISDIGIYEAGGEEEPANDATRYAYFSAPAIFIDITIIKVASGVGDGAAQVHYHTCNGFSGILSF